MDEDLSVKAPVTRLRRRMSMEAEDSPLPTTPSTPTKKRAARLAAKPQLELIDEIATENVPKKITRKTAVKEIEAEPNAGTPTTAVTPSRRSTRIRSNTSILSETTAQTVGSPRAKRALRRNSQLGSDTESASVTPARQTRRTAKDSAANVDKPAETAAENVVVYVVTSTNIDDTEKSTPKDSKENRTTNNSPPSRKSPRLHKKGDHKTDKDNQEINKTLNDSVHTPNTSKKSKDSTPIKNTEITINNEEAPKVVKDGGNISVSIINEIKKKDVLNKSIEKIANYLGSKRKRTKSWTTLSSSSNAGSTTDDIEAKDKIKSKTTNTSISGSGDASPTSYTNNQADIKSVNTSTTPILETIKPCIVSLTNVECDKSNSVKLIENSEAKKKMKNKTRISGSGDASPTSYTNNQPDIKSHNRSVNTSTSKLETIKPCIVSLPHVEFDKSDTAKLFENSPNNLEPFVLIEDSDTYSVDKVNIDIQAESGDQCVPEVANATNKSLNIQEQSVEPMDIDETVPMNVTIDDYSDKSNTSKDEVEIPNKRKSSVSEKSILKEDDINKSKRKSSISIQTASESLKFSISEENKNDTINKSKNSSKIISSPSVNKLNDSTKDKSKRTSSISKDVDIIDVCESKELKDKSLKKSSFGEENNDKLDKSANKLNRESYGAQNIIANKSCSKKSLDNPLINLSMSNDKENIEKLDKNSNKSKRKSSISLNNSALNQKSTHENNDSKSSIKPEKHSISQTDLLSLENKSTLVISQLKDVSTNETNNIMSPNVTNNVTNNELSKSLNGLDAKTKRIDKGNLSLNYLTSTPIQQKSLQKVAMQINTSIISPAAESANEKTPIKNEKKESFDSDAMTDEEIKFKNKEVVLPKKKFSRAPSSSESSDDESDTESQTPIMKPTKKSPIKKKSPNQKQLESSDSEEDSDSKTRQNNKNTSSKKQGNKSKSELKNEAMSVKSRKKAPSSDSSDTSDDSEEEPSKNRCKMINDEASEASDDYESGDSQNEEDRRFEEENEILEKGETLDSEEDLSNDSDYEKDSFLVSSDADDHDMLSGTGDDLSMTDNELTMSAKSKNKFNERKNKQQKKASREMYEARHKNDESADTSVTMSKKSKRQRLESSNLESENENTETKKSNRLKIGSSQDSSIIKSDVDESFGIKKKKSKCLSESVHDTTSNEKEITICNQSTTEKSDPLAVAIKLEPKTPQKKFDISSVVINNNITEVQVDPNTSILQGNNTLDPLQATVVYDDSSSSDKMEIFDMYDSVLSNLNTQNNKIKTADTSLNLNRKSKKSKVPVIDELNLTQTKKSKMIKARAEGKFTESLKALTKESSKVVDDNSSDSIDMKLLFPDDSNDSDINASQFKPKISNEPLQNDNNILQEGTVAISNILRNMEVPDNFEESEDNNIKIIIDTTGTHGESDTSMAHTNSRKKKKKNQSLDESKAVKVDLDIDCTDGIAETPDEASFTSEKKKKKNKNKSFDVSVNNEEDSFTVAKSHNEKKKKKSEFIETPNENTEGVAEIPNEISSEKKKKKNKNKSFDVSIYNLERSFTVSESHSEKKSKKKYESISDFLETPNENTDNTIVEEMPVNDSFKSDKKKKKDKHDASQTIEPVVEATNSGKKKSKKTSLSVDDVTPQAQELEPQEMPEISLTSEKKKKKNKQKLQFSQAIEDITGEETDNDAPVEVSYRSEKKSDATDIITDEASASSKRKKNKNKKKKNKNKELSQSMERSEDEVTTEVEDDIATKRKRKASGASETEDTTTVINTLTKSGDKKKRRIEDNEFIESDSAKNSGDGSSSKKLKKNKKLKNIDNIAQDEVSQQNSKKRKHRDDDNEPKVSKVSKQNSFDNIHVPTLPETVINKLSEKPQNKHSRNKKKKVQGAIATMPFIVEEAERRKNKPSNYLEQSIYLNDSPVKTKKKHMKYKPKVLPFIPTALTSDSGYTSQFNINKLARDTNFVAQTSNVDNFRESFLVSQRAKKLETLVPLKAHRSHKLDKF